MTFILLTGGAGYIGSHICVELITQGYTPVVFDNLSNSSLQALHQVQQITSSQELIFHQGDVRDRAALDRVFSAYDISAVIHLAGLKAVGESTEKPLLYYEHNVWGTINLAQAMEAAGVNNILFSSSATVYGDPEYLPIDEFHKYAPTNPYGVSKKMAEDCLLTKAELIDDFDAAILRYFNPIGAHPSGMIGEDPKGVPDNLIPYVSQVAGGVRPYVGIFGNDYDTPDGTGVRDYIHVVDLARAHVKAIEYLLKGQGTLTVNLGTGNGYSVFEIISAFEQASNKEIPYKIMPRRPGDIATCFADAQKAYDTLGWRAEFNMQKMCEDHWNWQHKNPKGYGA